MKKTKLISGALVFFLLFVSVVPTSFALQEPEAEAAAMIVADLDSGNILYEEHMNASRAPASLTKIMTVLLAVEAVENGNVQLSDMVTAQSDCREGLDESSSSAGIMPGEVMSFESLLYCAMVESANESCNIIGSYLEGSIGAFVDRMNEKAAELGAINTHFSDPNGLSNSNHYSTAYDLYLIAREAISHPLFMMLCDTDHYQVPATNLSPARELYNSNALISAGSMYGDGYVYEGAHGVKTGYTSLAGYCLISTAERDGVNLMAIVLGCSGYLNTGDSEYGNFVASRVLYDWAFENFSYRKVLTKGIPLFEMDVRYSKNGERAKLIAAQDIEILLPNDAPDPEIAIHPRSEDLIAPLSVGTALGTADIVVDGETYATVQLYAESDIEMAKADYIRVRIREIFTKKWLKIPLIIFAVLFAGYVALRIEYRKMLKKHLRERAAAAEKRKKAEEARRLEERKRRAAERKISGEAEEDGIIRKISRTEDTGRARNRKDADIDELVRSLGLDNKRQS